MAAAVIITDGVADAAITTGGPVTVIIAAGESIAQKPLPGGFLRISYLR
jgi:hypothetical protein